METNNELLIRIDERIKSMDERIGDISDDIKGVRKTLHGNGQKGLCEMVNEHTTTLESQEKRFRFWLPVGLTVVIIILSVIFAIINYVNT